MLQTGSEVGYWEHKERHPKHPEMRFACYGAVRADGTRAERWLTQEEFEKRYDAIKANARRYKQCVGERKTGKPTERKALVYEPMPIAENISRWEVLVEMVGDCVTQHAPVWIQCHLVSNNT